MEGLVPEVDFSAFELPPIGEKLELTEQQRQVGKQLYDILTAHGFVYAFGLLSPEEIAEVFSGSKDFFSDTDRSHLPRLTPATNVGYGGPGNETLNKRRGGDLKENFNVRKETLTDGTLKGTKEGFPTYCHRVWDLCASAAQRALLAFGVALALPDPTIFDAQPRNRCSNPKGFGEARTVNSWDLCTLRLLHYPVPPSNGTGAAALPCALERLELVGQGYPLGRK
eukprot:Skav233805  [mRNA]  locus=scaffold780:583255:587520:- [translate_table: standard]